MTYAIDFALAENIGTHPCKYCCHQWS